MLNREELPLPSRSDKNIPASVPSKTALLEARSHLSFLSPIKLRMKPPSCYVQIEHSIFFLIIFQQYIAENKD